MVDEREIDWQPMEAAPTDGRKIIIGQIAKWVPYMDPQKMGRTGRWQVRNDYGKWSNCDRANDYFITGYKPDDQSALLAERERVAALEAAAQKALQALRRNQAAGLRIGDAILWLSSVLESGYE